MIRPLPAAACVLVATLATMLAACQESSAPGATAAISPAQETPAAQPTADKAAADRAARDKPADDPLATSKPSADGLPAAIPAKLAASRPRRDITFDDLKFDIEKGGPFKRSMLTPKILGLDGQKVRIRGYILPSFQQTGLTQFVLVRDNLQCCFGPGAALYDCILVEMEPGRSADFTIRPVAVEGTLAIREYRRSGRDLAIYHLDGQQVE
ncbi:MAG TPA: DUF3299 domain-containing protein [Pirellulales bacterium]|jgi:hypothetical protein|nr:DUF3299 domain-containing protein [Pirellulales bacterium]